MSKLDEIIDEIDFVEFPANIPSPYEEVKQQIKALMLELIGEDNPHTPDAEAHFDTMDFKYPCCERVHSSNRVRQDLRKKVEEL